MRTPLIYSDYLRKVAERFASRFADIAAESPVEPSDIEYRTGRKGGEVEDGE
jgi:hypothetical protein